ncbi:13695_t:CDS:2, partial [Dentiscutata heterogama]
HDEAVSIKTIKNCWLYTKIISPCDNNETSIILSTYINNNEAINKYLPINPNDAKELQQVIDILCVCYPISLEDLLKAKEHEGALKIVDKRINDSGVMIKSLYKLQACIHEEVRKEEAKRLIQTTL